MLKRIFSYMKQYKKYAYLALVCIGIEVVLELMVPMLMADLIDNGLTLTLMHSMLSLKNILHQQHTPMTT